VFEISGTKDGHQEGGLVPSHACNIAEMLSAIEEGGSLLVHSYVPAWQTELYMDARLVKRVSGLPHPV
jgi:hypothetical protein